MNSWEMSTLGVISTSSTRISQADQTLFLLKTSCKFIWSYLSCRCLCFWSILKTSWKNPANILRTSRKHQEDIYRISRENPKTSVIIWKHLWTSENIWAHLEHIWESYLIIVIWSILEEYFGSELASGDWAFVGMIYTGKINIKQPPCAGCSAFIIEGPSQLHTKLSHIEDQLKRWQRPPNYTEYVSLVHRRQRRLRQSGRQDRGK